MTRNAWAGVILAAFLLTGCTAAQEAFVAAAAQKRMDYNDSKARVLVKAVCGMSVGAKNRLPAAQRVHVEGLCGGQSAPEYDLLAGIEALIKAVGKAD